LVATCLLLVVWVPDLRANHDLLITNARILDGSGVRDRAVSILIENGWITQIDPEIVLAEKIRTLDAAGLLVLPGLVDSHVHLSMSPGSGWRDDSVETERRLLERRLRAYLACGVTAVLDTGIDTAKALEIQQYLNSGGPGPTSYFLSPWLTTPGGYAVKNGAEPVATEQDVLRAFERSRAVGPVGVKTFIEYGFVRKDWPIHSPEMRDVIARIAADRQSPIYVHGTSEEENLIALDMGAHALVHSAFGDSDPPSREYLKRLHEQGTFVMTTVSVTEAMLIGYHPERLNDPLVQLTAPPEELELAGNPHALNRMYRSMIESLPDWLPDFVFDLFISLVIDEERIVGMVEAHLSNIADLNRSGVQLVMGSDSGNALDQPFELHGTTSLRELELLSKAGLSPIEVLRAATTTPATMLGLADETGAVEVGYRGDLVLLRDSPLDSPTAYRTVEWTVKGGRAHTPEEWMRI